MKNENPDGPRPVVLRTRRLILVAATLDHVRAELESPGCLASLLEAEVGAGWPPGEYDRDAQEFFRDRLAEGGHSAVGWYGWYAVRQGGAVRPSCPHPGNTLVGAGGYFGPPNEQGEAEIGFSMMPSSRNQGYATEMAEALVLNAFAGARVHRVLARAAAVNEASVKVLTKAGFGLVGPDPDTGTNLFRIVRA